MSTLGELLREDLFARDAPAAQVRADLPREEADVSTGSIRDEQIRSLVEQLFLHREAGPVRNVGFAPVEASLQTANLCLQVATVLAEEGKHEVGLIDAGSDPALLHEQLQIHPAAYGGVVWEISSRLWLVPRQSWWQESVQQSTGRLASHNEERLRECMTEFDFSVLCCGPVSALTARIGQNCDGLVLVLTANKTRRMVAAQAKDRLQKAQIRLLGTVLAERRFPVPQGLYRSL